MIVKIYFYLLGLFVLFLFLVNSVTAVSSQNFNALFYPYNIKSRAEAGYSLLSFIVLDSGVIALSREKGNLEKDVRDLCMKHNMDYKFIYTLIKLKSNFNPYKIALDGSVGLLALPIEKLKELNCKNPFNYRDYLDRALEIVSISTNIHKSPEIHATTFIDNIIVDSPEILNTNKVPLFYNKLNYQPISIK
jgi:hypothetical protein